MEVSYIAWHVDPWVAQSMMNRLGPEDDDNNELPTNQRYKYLCVTDHHADKLRCLRS
jgi:hypothetical protein